METGYSAAIGCEYFNYEGTQNSNDVVQWRWAWYTCFNEKGLHANKSLLNGSDPKCLLGP